MTNNKKAKTGPSAESGVRSISKKNNPPITQTLCMIVNKIKKNFFKYFKTRNKIKRVLKNNTCHKECKAVL